MLSKALRKSMSSIRADFFFFCDVFYHVEEIENDASYVVGFDVCFLLFPNDLVYCRFYSLCDGARCKFIENR